MERHCVHGLSCTHACFAAVISDSLQPKELYVAHQAPLSMGFSRQEYWSGLPCPPPVGSFWPRDRTRVSCLQVDSLLLSHWGSPHGLTIVSKTIFKFNAIPINFEHLCRNRKIHSQSSYSVSRDPQVAKINLKTIKADFKVSWFQSLLHKAIIIKTAWYWHKDSHRIESSSETNPSQR